MTRWWSVFFYTFTCLYYFSLAQSTAHVRKLLSFLYYLSAGEFVWVRDIDIRDLIFSFVFKGFEEFSWFDRREWWILVEGRLISYYYLPNTDILSRVGYFYSYDRMMLNPYSEFVFFISFLPEFISSSLFLSKISWWLYKWLAMLTPLPMEFELFYDPESLSLSYSDLCFGSIYFTSERLRFFVCFDFNDYFFSFCSCYSKKFLHNLNSSSKYFRYLFSKVSENLSSYEVNIRSYS